MGKVYIIGAGPGDPTLLTIKAQQIIQNADCILYAGSLVNPEILGYAKSSIPLYDTAKIPLTEQIEIMKKIAQSGGTIARLHTGDPSIYGAIAEQITLLRENGIAFEVIPGVTSAFAAAAALGIEFTLPEICQSLIFTRVGGRTPMPEAESLRSFAEHHCSYAIYLSGGMVNKVVSEFIAAGYAKETPAAAVYRASWDDQLIFHATLETIEKTLADREISHQVLLIISPALSAATETTSHLYGVFQKKSTIRTGKAILTLSADSIATGIEIQQGLENATLWVPEKFKTLVPASQINTTVFYSTGIRQVLQEQFAAAEALICLFASGIVMRELAPCLHNKHSDPAVIVTDQAGKNVISLLSGHLGGANRLAHEIAAITGGTAVITTASDTQDLPAFDEYLRDHSFVLPPSYQLTSIMAAIVNHDPIAVISDFPVAEGSPLHQFPFLFCHTKDEIPADVKIILHFTAQTEKQDGREILLHPKGVVLGIGCNRGTSAEEIEMEIRSVLAENQIAMEAVYAIATIPEKAEEAGILAAARLLGWEMIIVPHDKIRAMGALPTPSAYTRKLFGIDGVAEPCAMIGAGTRALLFSKTKRGNLTIAVAQKEIIL